MLAFKNIISGFVFSCIVGVGLNVGTISSTQAQEDSISVYIFLLDECVISTNYTAKINELHEKYKDRFGFLGVFPNFSSKPAAIEKWKANYNVIIPTKTDYFKVLSNKLRAKVTPEVVVYNQTKQEVLYRGRIDDQYLRVGKRRNKVRKHDLKNALDAIIAGQKIENKETIPIGCFINYNDKLSKI